MLEKVNLPQDSMDYIRWQLNIGAYLSEKTEEILDRFSAEIYTYLPEGVDPKILTDYSESIHYLTGISMLKESKSLVCDLIKNYLGKNSKNLAVFETFWEEHEFNTIICPLQHFFVKETRYDYLSGNEQKELIADYVEDAQGYPTVILLIEGEESHFRIRNRTHFPEDQIEELVKRIEYILIGAYNFEGYLIWQKI